MPTEHHLNATPFLAADQDHPFMATVYPFSKGYFQKHNGPCYKALISSKTVQVNDSDLSLLQWFHSHHSSARQRTFGMNCKVFSIKALQELIDATIWTWPKFLTKQLWNHAWEEIFF